VESLGLKWLNIQFLTPFGRATSSVTPDTEVAAREAMRTIDAFKDRMKFQIINLPFCFMPGYEEYLMGDLLKLERHMLFVNNEEVNLFEYLRERRAKKPVCGECPHSVFCGGFYEMEDVPEPTWLVRAGGPGAADRGEGPGAPERGVAGRVTRRRCLVSAGWRAGWRARPGGRSWAGGRGGAAARSGGSCTPCMRRAGVRLLVHDLASGLAGSAWGALMGGGTGRSCGEIWGIMHAMHEAGWSASSGA
jgi:hypothetical protein